jgi:hypothetical protein
MSNYNFENITNYSNSNRNFYSSLEQTIEPTKMIIFENGSDYITILESGNYIINLCAHFTSSCQLVLFINDSPELFTLTSSDSGLVSIYQIVKLEKNDEINIHKYS